MDAERFEELVAAGIDAVPERFLKKLNNVAIVVADAPTPEQRRKMRLRSDDILYGLYEGISLLDRNSGYTGVLPDKITIFQKEIEAVSRDDREIESIVRDTVWHEIAHHFGMGEHRVRRAEARRRRQHAAPKT